MTGSMHRLAEGELQTPVPFADRRDEIGAMASAVQVFKDNLIRTRQLEEETARIREINGVAASIAAAVEQQGAATNEIVRNVGRAAAGTSEVTGNIAGVVGAAEETGAATAQVLASASELSRQSEHLTHEVHRFLGTARAA